MALSIAATPSITNTNSTWPSRTLITPVPKARSPQTNGIVERLHKTMLNEFYRIAFRRKIYDSIQALQTDLDEWLDQYNNEREHQGRWCYGKTPMRTYLDSLELAREKLIPH